MTSQAEKCARLAALHTGTETFVIPNPWDIGSAKLLQGLGFAALATTSAGFAYTLGRADGEVTLAEKLAHCAALAHATTIPVSADFENGFADDPDDVATNVLALAATGVAGCSIEDYARDSHTLYPFEQAVERVQAAAAAVASLDVEFQLTARAENLLRGVDDLDATIARLRAFEAAGARWPRRRRSTRCCRRIKRHRHPCTGAVAYRPGAIRSCAAAAVQASAHRAQALANDARRLGHDPID